MCTHSLDDLGQSHSFKHYFKLPSHLDLSLNSKFIYPLAYMTLSAWHLAGISKHVQSWVPGVHHTPKFSLHSSHSIFQLLKPKSLVLSLSPLSHTPHFIWQQIPADMASKHVQKHSTSHHLCAIISFPSPIQDISISQLHYHHSLLTGLPLLPSVYYAYFWHRNQSDSFKI